MRDNFPRCSKYLTLFALLFSLNAGNASDEISSTKVVRLSGHIPETALTSAVFVESLEADVHVPITFTLPLRNQEELKELLQRLYDPADSNYRQYLSSDEFIEKFAPTEEDYNKVIDYAKELGLTINATHPNRLLINATGTARSVENAFSLSLHQYELPSGRKFYAPSDEPQVPESIASIISGVIGLDNQAKWRSFHYVKEKNETSNDESPLFFSGPQGGLSPSDIVKAYNLASIPVNGMGQNVALFQLGTYDPNDINFYASQFGLPKPKLKNIAVDGGAKDSDGEVTLDIELVLAVAPNSQIYVYEGPNSTQGVLDTYNKIATDNLAKQVSTSWGLAEGLQTLQHRQSESAIFMQMATQGQTMYAAAGDSGAYDEYRNTGQMKLAVDDPASQPYVTGVGGTRLTVNPSTGAHDSEVVWNNGISGAGGGGVSTIWPIPDFQKNVPTTFSKTNRNVPDVCLNSDGSTGYSIYYTGQWMVFGGTSCAAPIWAGYTALINEQLALAQKPSLGFLNPIIYQIGLSPTYSTNFYDVTSGDNLYYKASSGYDNATGWGSFNGANLFVTLTNSKPVNPPSPPTGTPVLNFTMRQTALYFVRGKTGTYNIQVANTGKGQTKGPVTVSVTIPNGLTYASFNGTGWSMTNNNGKLVFTESNTLLPGTSYQTITLNVNVNSNAPSSVSTIATLSGGGSVSSTVMPLTSIR